MKVETGAVQAPYSIPIWFETYFRPEHIVLQTEQADVR